MLAGGRFIHFCMKKSFFSIVSAVLKRDFQDVHPKNLLPLQYFKFVWLQLSEHVDITVLLIICNVTRKGKSLNSSHYETPIKLRSHRSSGAFLYVRNYLHFCIYLFLFRYFYLQGCRRSVVTVVNIIAVHSVKLYYQINQSGYEPLNLENVSFLKQ